MKAKRIVMTVAVLVLVLAMACALVSCDLFGGGGSGGGGGSDNKDTTYKVTVQCDTDFGSVSGGGIYKKGDSVTIIATANEGYTFIGRYDGETKVSDQAEWAFSMGEKAITYTAKFSVNSYTVNLDCDILKGSVTGGGNYEYGSSVTIVATAKTGYSFVGWYEGDTLVSDEAEYTITKISQNATYIAKFSANKHAVIVECNSTQGSVTGGGNYDYGSSVAIKAIANDGYAFIGWYDGETLISSNSEYNFILGDSDIVYTAKFNIISYSVNVHCDLEQGRVVGGGNYEYGSSVTIVATVKTGYSFVGWFDGENFISDETNYTFTCKNNVSYTAKFNKLNFVQISCDEAQGDVAGGGEYNNGESVTISATAKSGYSFVGWYEGAKLVSADAEYTFVMGSNGINYIAKFKANQYSLTLECDSEQGAVTGSGEYDYGRYVTITAIANEGYSFVGWYDGATLVSADVEYAFIIGDMDVKFSAKFIINNYNVILECDSMQGSVSGGGNYDYGSNVIISATAKIGYLFVGWYDGDVLISENSEFTINNISENLTYTARFIINKNTVTVQCDLAQGNVIGGGIYDYGSSVTISATAKTGYSFVGWYEEERLVSNEAEYTFNVPTNVTYIAKFDIDPVLQMFNVSIFDNGEIIIKGLKDEFKDVDEIIVPNIVSRIDNSAFYGCSKLKNVTIPNSVTSIGESAFYGCNNISEVKYNGTIEQWSSVSGLGSLMGGSSNKKLYINDSEVTGDLVIPDGVTSISGYAFSGCSSLTSVTIPDSVTSIGFSAFYGCCNISEVRFNGTIEHWCATIGLKNLIGYLLNRKLYIGGIEIAGDLVIPDSVASIGDSAFYACTGLTSITIPDSVISIGDSAFSYCSGLTSVTIPNSVMEIGMRAFQYSSLTSVTIPDSVTSIGSSAFYNCSSIASVTIPDSVTNIGYGAFSGCNSISEVKYNGTIEQWLNISGLGNLMGYGSNKRVYIGGSELTELVVPNSVTSIDDDAFYGCSGLTSVTMGSGVKSIGNHAFSGCSSLISITIPDSVTSIGQFAFAHCRDLTNVTIGNGVTSIAWRAFYNCSRLTSVTIGISVTTIDNFAFYGCRSLLEVYNLSSLDIRKSNYEYGYLTTYALDIYTSLSEPSKLSEKDGMILHINRENITLAKCIRNEINVIIPSNITNIGSAAFIDCSNISEVRFNGTIEQWLAIRGLGNLMSNSSNKKLYIGDNEITGDLVIPNGVISIGSSAFEGCSSLTNVTIPNSVTSIGSEAFAGCSGLTSVTIGNSVTSIGDNAFNGCSDLTSVTIGSGVTNIGSSAFYNCYALAEIYNLSSLKITKGSSDYGYVAYYARNVYTSLSEPSKLSEKDGMMLYSDGNNITLVRYIGNETNVIIPNDITSIGKYAFYNCSSLTNVTIPNSVTSIGNSAFYGCSNLTSITLPFVGAKLGDESNTHFGYIFGAYNYSDNVKFVPESLQEVIITGGESIGNYAFYNCSSLASITIGNSVTSIGWNAFYSCGALTSVTIGNSVTNIGDSAFSDCSSLTSVTIPDSVTSIEDNAFSDCSSLTSVIIGNGVTSIGDDAFSGCTDLTSITITDSVTSIGLSAFYNCSGLTSITIPDSVTSIGNFAFHSCSNLTSVTIGSGVISIGNIAFSGCSSLTSVTIGSGVTSIGWDAFKDCSNILEVRFNGTIEQWCVISGLDDLMRYGSNKKLYIGGFEVAGDFVIPDGVTSIGRYAFRYCSNLTSVTFENMSGWFVSGNSDATSGTAVTVTNPTQNAKYLKDTYTSYYWERK